MIGQKTASLLALALLALLACPRAALAADKLPQLGTEAGKTSVSGLSSGAYMAGQIQLAHSKDIIGAGLVAGGPHGCAETESSRSLPFWPTAVVQNTAQALNSCMGTDGGTPDVTERAKRAAELAEQGDIDPLSGLADDKVYLFSGNEDETVRRAVVEAAKAFYEKAGVPAANISLVERKGGHAFLTEANGGECGISVSPYVSDCDYDQAKAILEWIYGPLAAPSKTPKGKFVPFDQREYSDPGDGFADEGVVYVPPSCAGEAGCRLHIVLHGCEQSRETVRDEFIKASGFAELADSNRLVVLFPQISARTINPKGCWDWWGYTGLDYLGKDAPQIAAIWAMAEGLAKP